MLAVVACSFTVASLGGRCLSLSCPTLRKGEDGGREDLGEEP